MDWLKTVKIKFCQIDWTGSRLFIISAQYINCSIAIKVCVKKVCSVFIFLYIFSTFCRRVKRFVPLERYKKMFIFSTHLFFKIRPRKWKENEEENLLLLIERCYENDFYINRELNDTRVQKYYRFIERFFIVT